MTIIITDEDVRTHLPMPACIEAMRVAFCDLSDGKAANRPRMRYLAAHPDPELRYFANVHIGAVPSSGVACVRAGSQIMRPPGPNNARRMYENPTAFNWGLVILYSIETAEPLALMHEFQLSGLRVGATTGLAVDRLSRPEARTLGLFGTGKQARNALEAILTVRAIDTVRVYSPTAEHLAAFVAQTQRPGVQIVAAAAPEAVVEGADIVCCATSATRPLFDGTSLVDGQCVITTANSDVTNQRSEVDRTVFDRARCVVINDWESVEDSRQRELLDPIEEGTLDRGRVHELGDVLTGKAQPDLSGIAYYKNNSGLAIQFAAAGGILYRRIKDLATTKSIPTEWLGSDLSAYYDAGYRPSP